MILFTGLYEQYSLNTKTLVTRTKAFGKPSETTY